MNRKLALGATFVSMSIAAFIGAWFALIGAANARLAAPANVAVRPIPVPWPLTAADLAGLRKAHPDGIELQAVAMQYALLRGEHLFHTRGFCTPCHGDDLAGRVMADDWRAGTLVAPNITPAGVAASYTAADWVSVIRHGRGPDGRALDMPSSETYARMFNDRELSDLIAWLMSLPPTPSTLPPSKMGPGRAVRLLSGNTRIAAEHISPDGPWPGLIPAGPTVDYGSHLGVVCTTCHPGDLAGLEGWSVQGFEVAMRTGVRPDGTVMDRSMPWDVFAAMDDDEIEAIYAWLRSLQARSTPATR